MKKNISFLFSKDFLYIFLVNIFSSFICFLYGQIIFAVFDPYKEGIFLIKFKNAIFRNQSIINFIILSIPISIFISYFCKPIFSKLEDQFDIKVIINRIFNLPIIIYICYILGFATGPILSYILFPGIKLIPAYILIPASSLSGLFIVNFILELLDRRIIPQKIKLQFSCIFSKKRKEISLFGRFLNAFIGAIGTLIFFNLVILYYFIIKKEINFNYILKYITLNSVVIISVTILQVYMIIYNIKTKLKSIENELQKIKSEDVIKLYKIPIVSFDEFGELTENFNNLLQYLFRIIENINKVSIEINDTLNGFEQVIKNSNIIIEDFIKENNTLNVLVNKLYGEIEILNNLNINFNNKFSEIKDSINKQNKTMDLSYNNSDLIISTIYQNYNDINSVKDNFFNYIEKVKKEGTELIKSMKSITSIKNFIDILKNFINTQNEISDQIKILSLNASIESARSGIWGRGFKVVANEISTLSEKSFNLLKEMNVSTNEIISKLEEGFNIINTSINNLKNIVNESEETKNIFNSMVKKFDIQKEKTIEFQNTIKELSKLNSNVVRNSEEGMVEIKKVQDFLKDLLKSNENLSNILKEKSKEDKLKSIIEIISKSKNILIESVNNLNLITKRFNFIEN